MAGKTDTIGRIERKVTQLIAENETLRRRVEKLSASKESMRDENRELSDKVAELERRVAVMELREGFAGGNRDSKTTKAAKQRVNRMIREIDSCLKILNAAD